MFGRRNPASVVRGAGPSGGRVALTFDDGPHGATTDAVLDCLARHDLRATFFVIGQQAELDPARVVALHAAGHEVANHTWSHPDLRTIDADALDDELHRTSALLQELLGAPPALMRAPYGARNRRVDRAVRAAGMRHVLWSVDTRDWSRPGTEAIVATVERELVDGAIVLLHDGGGDRSQTLAALDRIIEVARTRELRPVTVSELLAPQ